MLDSSITEVDDNSCPASRCCNSRALNGGPKNRDSMPIYHTDRNNLAVHDSEDDNKDKSFSVAAEDAAAAAGETESSPMLSSASDQQATSAALAPNSNCAAATTIVILDGASSSVVSSAARKKSLLLQQPGRKKKSNCLSCVFTRRTRLEKLLAASLLCSLVAIVFLLLVSLHKPSLPYGNSDETFQVNSFIHRPDGQRICLTPHCIQTSSYLLAAMDMSANPCNDFFQFACGAWNRKHVIPEDRSSISTFEVLADQLQIILKGILEEDRTEGDNEATVKAKYFYQSCMDMEKIAEVSDKPLRTVISNLGGWPVTDPDWSENTTLPLAKILGLLKRNFTLGVLIEEWVGPDDRDSKRHIIQIDQMQLGLPSRDYFLHLESDKDLEAYHLYMTDVAVLLGANRSQAYKELRTVVELEQLLANISVPEEDRLDTGSIYAHLTLEELETEIPQIDWLEYFDVILKNVSFNKSEGIVSYSMPYFKELGKLLEKSSKRVVHNYVIWRLVMDLMPHMPPQYETTRAEFRRVLLGVLTDRNRWNRCVEWTNKKMGMAVGALFIRDNFNHESKATALEMIHSIRAAFNELLEENEWMDMETRLVAKDKANSMNERIGYPEYITNTTRLEDEYRDLNIGRDTFLVNLFDILRFEAERNVDKLRKPVDKDKWATEPAVVNAFYNPNKNDIVFPAGILQPLFYSQHFPKSLNYGGIGVVIGHEITHGFDDKGRQFDKHGNLKQWWNNRTIGAFRQAAQCIVDQYSEYSLEEINLPVNGKMTQGENIADNGGLKQAFRAYRKWVQEHGEEALLPGLNMTHDQLFFLNYAQIWCGSMRPEDALTKIRSSVHSPGPIRVLGPLSNSWDFAKAYGCPLRSRMNPEKKCSVW